MSENKTHGTNWTLIFSLAIFVVFITVIMVYQTKNSEILLNSSLAEHNMSINKKEGFSIVLTEVKNFNNLLNQRQQQSIQLLLYFITFISIIALFFGYKTIKDIRDSTDDQVANMLKQKEFEFDADLNSLKKTLKEAKKVKKALNQEISELRGVKENKDKEYSTANASSNEEKDKELFEDEKVENNNE